MDTTRKGGLDEAATRIYNDNMSSQPARNTYIIGDDSLGCVAVNRLDEVSTRGDGGKDSIFCLRS